jgi:hypothetical protein
LKIKLGHPLGALAVRVGHSFDHFHGEVGGKQGFSLKFNIFKDKTTCYLSECINLISGSRRK